MRRLLLFLLVPAATVLLASCDKMSVSSLEGTHWQCAVENVANREGETVSGTYSLHFGQNEICELMLNGQTDGRAEYAFEWPDATLRVYSTSRSALFPTDSPVVLHLDDKDHLSTTVGGTQRVFARAD